MKHLALSVTLLLAIVVGFSSCNNGSGILSASSTANEVLVVMDDQSWKEGLAGRALFDVAQFTCIRVASNRTKFQDYADCTRKLYNYVQNDA